jgi:hypothetical protein
LLQVSTHQSTAEGQCVDWSKVKFVALVLRDFLLFGLIVNALALLCSVFMWLVDSNRKRDELFTFVFSPFLFVITDQQNRDVLSWDAPHLFIDWVLFSLKKDNNSNSKKMGWKGLWLAAFLLHHWDHCDFRYFCYCQ